MILFSWISYQGVKNAAINTGKERLVSLTSQLGSMFSQSMSTLSSTTRTRANHASLKHFLADTSYYRDSAMHVLDGIRQDSTSVLVDLYNAKDQLVLRSSRRMIHQRVNFDSIVNQLELKDDTTVGNIYLLSDSMYYPVIQPVWLNQRIVGSLVRWRLLYTTPQTIEQLSQLMGTKARLYIGNGDGSLWTDLVKPVGYHMPDSMRFNKPIEHRNPERGKFFAAYNSIQSTPWLVSLEISQQNLLDPATRFLQWMVIGGLILLGIGILLAWIMSRNIIRPLNRLTEAASGIAHGNYIPTEGADRRDEVGKLARAFNTMLEQVREARQGLEQKVVESGEMNEQLRNLTAHLQNIREEERIHIAREMHDELGQVLTAFKMDISWLQKRLGETAEEPTRVKLAEMSKLVDDAVVFVRKVASELRPSVLDDFGLVSALEWHSVEFQKRFQIDVDFRSNTREVHTSALVATGLFRMYQETLTNVARHANASKVTTRLDSGNGLISLSIRDNGQGFNLNNGDQKRKTLGLLGMKERAAMIGGHLEIKSSPGEGTAVHITVTDQQENQP